MSRRTQTGPWVKTLFGNWEKISVGNMYQTPVVQATPLNVKKRFPEKATSI